MHIFITGGTGYIGSALIPLLVAHHRVSALVRPASAHKLAGGCRIVCGDALMAASYASALAGVDTLVHLVGVSHPSPAKAKSFRSVDLASVREALNAARQAGVAHFVYLSVAQPAPVMGAYLAARAEGESLIRTSGINATVLRPWYVIGPAHHWPLLLLPAYALLERLPATREAAQRLGLVSLGQMVAALRWAVEQPPEGVRIWGVAEIREAAAHPGYGVNTGVDG